MNHNEILPERFQRLVANDPELLEIFQVYTEAESVLSEALEVFGLSYQAKSEIGNSSDISLTFTSASTSSAS